MNKAWLLLLTLAFAPLAANAADMGMMRGGFGFLYPDNNGVSSDGSGDNFTNSSMLASSMGTAIQAEYLNEGSGLKSVAPSLVYGNGKFGLGVFGARGGSDLTTSGQYTDEVGVGLGVGLIKDHLNFGVGYSRVISGNQTNSGDVQADLTLMGGKDKGASVGVGVNTTLGQKVGSNVMGGTAGVGYSFKKGTSVEANIHFNDVNNTSDYDLDAFFNLSSQMVYFSAGAGYMALPKWTDAEARLGFVLGKNFDLSGMVRKIFATGTDLQYGASLRVML